MADERQIRKKMHELFSESNKNEEDFQQVFSSEKSELQDMSPDEQKEIRGYVAEMLGRGEENEKAKAGPKKKWVWKFYGWFAFRALLFLVMFILMTGAFFVLIPLSININVTIIQALSIASLLVLVKTWIKYG